VLINLLSNAVKFTQEGGVTLRVKSADWDQGRTERRQGRELTDQASWRSTPCCQLHFEVEDTGVGIAPDDLEGIFDPFVQAASGQTAQEGTGLGLPISRQFVRLMGGDIEVDSVLGQGSVFRFDAQVELTEASDVPLEPPARRVVGLEPDQPVYRLLVVEDRESNRKLLVRLLTSLSPSPAGDSGQGFEVREALNGQQAVEMWKEWAPHLIWMDMRMPVMDGHEATRRIKGTTEGQGTVIIALTASAFEEDRRAVLASGCDDFVRKPFREVEILDKLTKHLGVRFIYEEVASSAQGPSSAKPEDVVAALKERLTREALVGLPAGWVSELSQAALQADGGLVLDLVDRVRSRHAPVAEALASLVHSYRFDAIVKLTEELGE
jgi:CheY-like chemotaxis protein